MSGIKYSKMKSPYIEKIEQLKKMKLICTETFRGFRTQYEKANEQLKSEMDRLAFYLDVG